MIYAVKNEYEANEYEAHHPTEGDYRLDEYLASQLQTDLRRLILPYKQQMQHEKEWYAFVERHSLEQPELVDEERATLTKMLATLEKELCHTQQMLDDDSC